MSYFNKKKDEQLIIAVKAKPVLYLARHPDNRSCIAKYHAWQDISQTLDIPIPALKKRWKHLRDHYKKKVKQTKNNANNKWEYMPLLGFLKKKTNVDCEMSSGVDDRTDDDIVIKVEECSGSEHSNLTDNVNVNAEERNKDLDVSVLHVTNEDTNKEDKGKSSDAADLGRTELEDNVDKMMKRKKLERNSEVPAAAKKMKSDGEKDDAKSEEISNILNLVRRRLESVLIDIGKCEASARRSGMKAGAEMSPVHRFFQAVADIVELFPPHFIAEARSTTCTIINELEKECLQTNEWIILPQ